MWQMACCQQPSETRTPFCLSAHVCHADWSSTQVTNTSDCTKHDTTRRTTPLAHRENTEKDDRFLGDHHGRRPAIRLGYRRCPHHTRLKAGSEHTCFTASVAVCGSSNSQDMASSLRRSAGCMPPGKGGAVVGESRLAASTTCFCDHRQVDGGVCVLSTVWQKGSRVHVRMIRSTPNSDEFTASHLSNVRLGRDTHYRQCANVALARGGTQADVFMESPPFPVAKRRALSDVTPRYAQ